jgi:hypothetical protein
VRGAVLVYGGSVEIKYERGHPLLVGNQAARAAV